MVLVFPFILWFWLGFLSFSLVSTHILFFICQMGLMFEVFSVELQVAGLCHTLYTLGPHFVKSLL